MDFYVGILLVSPLAREGESDTQAPGTESPRLLSAQVGHQGPGGVGGDSCQNEADQRGSPPSQALSWSWTPVWPASRFLPPLPPTGRFPLNRLLLSCSPRLDNNRRAAGSVDISKQGQFWGGQPRRRGKPRRSPAVLPSHLNAAAWRKGYLCRNFGKARL